LVGSSDFFQGGNGYLVILLGLLIFFLCIFQFFLIIFYFRLQAQKFYLVLRDTVACSLRGILPGNIGA